MKSKTKSFKNTNCMWALKEKYKIYNKNLIVAQVDEVIDDVIYFRVKKINKFIAIKTFMPISKFDKLYHVIEI